ncbi:MULTISPECIES: hypothetical protein [unclassified Xanthobacter]|uniref:secretion/conjugation apparatus DotM-related subunit n=1 Tax=unclassified Xanthobacter TaxID=2623496 RepID=UPI001F2E9BB6|nr:MULTISPECIES: hypothetical protein [unclassified Xanthobacter]
MAERPEYGDWWLFVLSVGLLTLVGGVLWLVVNPVLGPVYRVVRLVETGGLWLLTGWGKYFFSVPWGGGYEFAALFRSSIPFGMLLSVLVGLMGYSAYKKVIANHIDSFTAHEQPPGYRDIMRKVSALYPHNDFFLRFDMSAYPQDRGAAGMPMTAQEFLRSVGATSFRSDGTPVFDQERIRDGLKARFGDPNPFLRCFDSSERRSKRIASPAEIRERVAALPWHQAVLLFAALTRINAMAGKDEKLFLKNIRDVDDYMRDIWRAINEAVRSEDAEGMREVVLDITPDNFGEKPKVSLAAFLNEPVGPAARPRAEAFSEVKGAREALVYLITGEGAPGEVEKLANAKIPIVMVAEDRPQTVIDPILAGHGFIAGVLAHSLVETRKSGIFPPNGFLWMRFVDQNLWRFLVYVGLATPCAEAAGLYEHWRAEMRMGEAILEPFIEEAPNAVLAEARKYVFDPEKVGAQFDASIPDSLMTAKDGVGS